MRAAVLLVLSLATATATAGCTDGAGATTGADALLRAQGGQYVRGAFPVAVVDDAGSGADDAGTDVDAGADGGDAGLPAPSVTSATLVTNRVRQGFHGKQVGVLVSQNARTLAVGLEVTAEDGGVALDRGYWLVPVGTPSLEAPPNLDTPVTLDFSSDVPVGPARLLLAAQDALGRFGPARAVDLIVTSALPVADLVIALDWTSDMDLDLVVEQPDGSMLTFAGLRAADGTTVRPAPGQPVIDVDSNGGCVIDGARTEAAAWDAPMPGVYRVRVRPTASCGQTATGWRVRVLRGTALVATVTGATYASQVDAPGGGPTGHGQLATEIAVGE